MNSEFLIAATTPQAGGGQARRQLAIALGIHHLVPRGGLEDNCIRIGEELGRRGHSVTLFVGGQHPALSMPTVALAAPVRFLSNHWRAALFARRFIAATKGRFDRIVAFQPVPGADVLFTADWLRDRPDIPWWQRLTPRFRTYAGLEAQCFAAGARTRIIGLSGPQIRAYLDRYGTSPDRIELVPPTLSAEKRKPEHRTEAVRARMRSELGLNATTPLWLWLGLQPEVKGLDRVLAALAGQPQAHLLVAGVAGESAKLRQYRAATKAAEGRVHWLGYVSDERLHDSIAAADVLAHPARLDITGGVILEAIVNGLPVVATSICGFAEHIRMSGAGKVVEEPFDADRFQAALAEVCGPGNAAYSAKGIAYGNTPSLYTGTSAACDLIEAPAWPVPRHSGGRVIAGAAPIAENPFTTG
jgi:UDP-glucose:(heptosyl)LPS alpha-1,3-glucosyltransferase